MARLLYSAITSLDGYIADEQGSFDWAAPGDDVHAFINDLERPVHTYLYGRRMYEVMAAWENPPASDDEPPPIHDFAAIWKAAEKIVYSRTLREASSARTRIERDFDPAAIRQMKRSTASDISIGGAELAGEALRAGLVDEVQQFVAPVVVGGGTPFLPLGLRLTLELLDERRFSNGMVYLRYRVRV